MPVTSKEIRIARRIAKRTRVFAACARCKASKVKCNDYRPCNKCAENFNSCNEPIARGSETTNLIVKAARAFNDDTVMNSVHFDNVMSRPLVPNSQFSKITDEDRSRRGPVPTTMLGYKNSMLDSQFPMLNVLAQTAPQQFLPSGPTLASLPPNHCAFYNQLLTAQTTLNQPRLRPPLSPWPCPPPGQMPALHPDVLGLLLGMSGAVSQPMPAAALLPRF